MALFEAGGRVSVRRKHGMKTGGNKGRGWKMLLTLINRGLENEVLGQDGGTVRRAGRTNTSLALDRIGGGETIAADALVALGLVDPFTDGLLRGLVDAFTHGICRERPSVSYPGH